MVRFGPGSDPVRTGFENGMGCIVAGDEGGGGGGDGDMDGGETKSDGGGGGGGGDDGSGGGGDGGEDDERRGAGTCKLATKAFSTPRMHFCCASRRSYFSCSRPTALLPTSRPLGLMGGCTFSLGEVARRAARWGRSAMLLDYRRRSIERVHHGFLPRSMCCLRRCTMMLRLQGRRIVSC